MQYLLDRYFNGIYKNVFYLNWTTMKIKWLNDIPSKCNFKKECTWAKKKIMVCGYFPKEKEINHTSSYSNINYLKSHLQKCIRRGNLYSKNTAYEMLFLDNASFLRRLPIIVVEDVILVDTFPILIWLMLMPEVTKRQSVVMWLIGFVGALTKLNKKGNYNKLKQVGTKADNMVWALEIRKDYGGMKGDMALLNGVIYDYLNGGDVIKMEINPEKGEPLPADKWELSAIDFHCSDILSRLDTNTSYHNLKKIVWNHRSSINFRNSKGRIIPYDEYKTWNEIKDQLDIISKELIYRNS